MLKRIPVLIPENLDLQELVKINPTNFRVNLDNIKYIVSLISELPAWDNELLKQDDYAFVPINAILLQKVIWNYDEYLRYLQVNGVLECDNYYIPKSKSKGFRFTETYRVKPKEETISIPKVLDRIHRTVQQRNHTAFKQYPNLIHWFEGLEINAPSAVQYLDDLYRKEIEEENILTEVASRRYAARYSMVSRVAEKNYLYTVDNCGHRFHSCLTNLKSELRQYLSYKGHSLVSIDISNSQPFLAGCLLNNHFYEPIADDSRITLFNLSSNLVEAVNLLIPEIKRFNLSSSFPSSSLVCGGSSFPMLVKSSNEQTKADVICYLNQVQTGNFYEFMQELAKRTQGQGKLSRKEIKEMCMTVFFSNPKDQHKYFRLQRDSFSSLFPTVYDLFNVIKSHQHNTLAILLQGIESELILNKICGRISGERPDLPIFTIHDSICTTVGNEEYIEGVMNEELFNAVGLKPHFKREYWFRNDASLCV